MGVLGFNFNLLDQLTFYGSYHSNKWNQLIHVVFVPAILWSALVWLCYTGPLFGADLPAHLAFLPEGLARYCVLNGAALFVAAYWLYYLTLEFFAGLTWGLVIGAPLWVAANALYQATPLAWAWALGVHVLSWYMQIHPGHALLEGRKPALLDSFFQSLVLAPLFVWMEVLFVFGYRPKLYAQLKERVRANLAEYRSQREALLKNDHVDSKQAAAAK